ncbi:MAG: sulfurtransferase [Alphaproteobacteria bacterium]|nr:sulfurtransferase [Alphaproteobacteria bacterium]
MSFAKGGLVETDWLAGHLDDPDLRVFDCTVFLTPDGDGGVRIESGRAHWAKSHIPGAGFLDLVSDLSDTSGSLRFMMPSAAQFERAVGAAGLGDGSRVVLYCAGLPVWATRVWWMLRAFGFDDAAVLNGGWAAWKAEGRPVSDAQAAYPPARFTARPRDGLFADKQAVKEAVGDGRTCIVNGLSRDIHEGRAAAGPRRGRIAGSVNLPVTEMVDESMRLLDDETLRARFETIGAGGERPVVTYCGGGIAATLTAFALARLGYEDVAVYDGSLSEWSADPDTPMETGPQP